MTKRGSERGRRRLLNSDGAAHALPRVAGVAWDRARSERRCTA
jgi:hypothetical protein